jgi:hypothetical protein
LACVFALAALAFAAPNSIAHASSTSPVGRYLTLHHGETGQGLGASHQTGWTVLAGALVAGRRLWAASSGQSDRRADCLPFR